MVSGVAITTDSGRARRSVDTSGLSVAPITPHAARKAAFTACTVAVRAVITLRSTQDTLATGTRTAWAMIRPATCGKTTSSSCAAEVVVGTIDSAAARLRG